MSDVRDGAPTVEEYVEYCRTQARLLDGRAETTSAEAADLLDEIDDRIAEMDERLGERVDRVEETVAPPSTDAPDEVGVDVDALEAVERDLEAKQSLVEAKQARIAAFRDLAAGYADLAGELGTTDEDATEALRRIVEFEADRDAPAYFEDRETLCEVAAKSSGSAGE